MSGEYELQQAIKLRKEKEFERSNSLLQDLCTRYPDEAEINYQYAWSFDILGEESRAAPYYEKAIEIGLTGDDLKGAFLGLGSTYRTLGQYDKSKAVFLKGIESFPEDAAMKTFYAMTLYNLGKHDKAMELLLRCIANTSDDKGIIAYKNAITFYSDKLSTVWK